MPMFIIHAFNPQDCETRIRDFVTAVLPLAQRVWEHDLAAFDLVEDQVRSLASDLRFIDGVDEDAAMSLAEALATETLFGDSVTAGDLYQVVP